MQDHLQGIEETTFEVRMVSNPDARGEARKDLPMLRLDLHLAHVALQAAGGDDDTSGSGDIG